MDMRNLFALCIMFPACLSFVSAQDTTVIVSTKITIHVEHDLESMSQGTHDCLKVFIP
jgi:hypothetical protein